MTRHTKKNTGEAVDRKEKIINAAFKLMASKGAAFLKLKEVAKEAKVPAPLIHYYFKDVEDLHYEIILKTLESLKNYSLSEIPNSKEDSIKIIKAYVRGPFLWAKKYPTYFGIWMYFYYLASYSERFKTLNSQVRMNGRERIELMIYKGIEKNQFKVSNQSKISDIALEIQTLISGYVILSATEHPPLKLSESHEEICINKVLKLLGA